MTIEILNGILHEVPDDMQTTLSSNATLLEKWNKLTPIQRNEWICWVTIVKKQEQLLNFDIVIRIQKSFYRNDFVEIETEVDQMIARLKK